MWPINSIPPICPHVFNTCRAGLFCCNARNNHASWKKAKVLVIVAAVVVTALLVNYSKSVLKFVAVIKVILGVVQNSKTSLAADVNSVIYCYIKGHEHHPKVLYCTP